MNAPSNSGGGSVVLLILAAASFLILLYLLADSYLKSKESKNRQTELQELVTQMSKDLKLCRNDVSQILQRLASRNDDSTSKIDRSLENLSAFESKLKSMGDSLTSAANVLKDTAFLESQLTEAKKLLEGVSRDLVEATDKAKILERENEVANHRINELELTELKLRQDKGTAPVASDRDSIREAIQLATNLAWQQGATADAQLAKKAVEDEGALILRAFDAASKRNTEGAAAIVEASPFDPFRFHKNLWEGTAAAKYTLELVRAAAWEGMKSFGFEVDNPRINIDTYEKSRHDLRDSIPTEKEELKGKIAEVRRPGLRFEGRVVRPARVVQYAIDYRKSTETGSMADQNSSGESPLTSEATAVARTSATSDGQDVQGKKGGASEF